MEKAIVPKRSDFSFLDQGDFKSKYEDGPSGMRFYVGGMSCARCVSKLEKLAQTMSGVRSVRVDLGKSLLKAEIDPEKTSFEALANKIEELGFEPVPLAREVNGEQIQRQEDRAELIRLGVAGALAGNIMTFSFATYFGAPQELCPVFCWISFFLYLPVVSYVALPFYKGAISSLRNRRLSVDLPMAVASLAGFLFSTVELLRGHHDIYFDSLSGFLFLILASRFAQRRMQRKFLSFRDSSESLQLHRVRKVRAGKDWAWTTLEHASIGDRMVLHAGETLSCDAQLEGRFAHFSLAWLSGESKAKIFLPGATVPAGARLTAGEAKLAIVKKLEDTEFGKILRHVDGAELNKARTISLTDRWAQRLLITVFAAAIGFLVFYWQVSSEEAIRRSLALIILACPCAMAFGTPLAFASAFSRARRKGLLVRSPRAFENAAETKTIFFDKTGTLTETNLILGQNAKEIPDSIKRVVLALENQSLHPIAFAFRSAFESPGYIPDVKGFLEVPGDGVSGFIQGRFYELRRDNAQGNDISCTLFCDMEPLKEFTFHAQLKPKSAESINDLRRKGYKLVLLSGDNKGPVMALARELGFATEETIFGADPLKKARFVAETEHSMMVGDGVNDSLAMLQARVAVATSGGVEAALKSSDVYLTDSAISGVAEFLQIAKSSMGLVRQNLIISIAYNSIAGALALLGYINPFVAAVLMPVSSGFILLSTWLRSRT